LAEGNHALPISFPIPLAAALKASKIRYVTTELNPDPTNCTGTTLKPAAASGFLCIYQGSLSKATFVSAGGAGVSGILLTLAPTTEEPATGSGSWAVTG
jgi:hypothetical protein